MYLMVWYLNPECPRVSQENCVYETVVPPLDERDFEKTVTPIVQEYFEHADTNEVAVSVQETCQ